MIFENIEKLCRERGISLSALENLLGFGNSTISKWRTSSPSVAKLKLVADYFGVTIDEIVGGG